ncbi:hypothetical protein NEIG_01791 [Nematocida sp. ERTm5]|nr:hypothetical protein NEIG_01791 [Nematocida sp. ERTm5]
MRRSTKYIFIIGMLIIKLSLVYTASEQKEEFEPSKQEDNSENMSGEIIEIIERKNVSIDFLKGLNDEIQSYMNFYLNKNKFTNDSSKESTSLESANPSTENAVTKNVQPSIIYQSIYKVIEEGNIIKNISGTKITANYKIVDIPVLTSHIEAYYKEVVDDLRRIIIISASMAAVKDPSTSYNSFLFRPEGMAKYFLSLISTPYIFSKFDFNDLLKHKSPDKYIEMIKYAKSKDELNSLMKVFDNASHEACRFFAYVSNKIYEFMEPEKEFAVYIEKKPNTTTTSLEIIPYSHSQAKEITVFLIRSQQCFCAWRAKTYAFILQAHEWFVIIDLILSMNNWDLSGIELEKDSSKKDKIQDSFKKVYKIFNLLENEIKSKELFQEPEQILKIRDDILSIGISILKLMKTISLTLHKNAKAIEITKRNQNNPNYPSNLEKNILNLWNVAAVIKKCINIPVEYQGLSIDEYTARLEKDLIELDNKKKS